MAKQSRAIPSAFTTKEDQVLVEEVREIFVAFGDALFTTIHEARKPSGKASDGRKKAYDRWEVLADRICLFAKENERVG